MLVEFAECSQVLVVHLGSALPVSIDCVVEGAHAPPGCRSCARDVSHMKCTRMSEGKLEVPCLCSGEEGECDEQLKN